MVLPIAMTTDYYIVQWSARRFEDVIGLDSAKTALREARNVIRYNIQLYYTMIRVRCIIIILLLILM